MIKKRRDECIILLDDCFDCKSAADRLTEAGFSISRFHVHFPSEQEGKRAQNVKDDLVIKLCHQKRFLLLTMDKSMRETHAAELLKTDIGVIATTSNEDGVAFWVEKIIDAKAKVLRHHKKNARPYFSVIHKSGELQLLPIKQPKPRGAAKTG